MPACTGTLGAVLGALTVAGLTALGSILGLLSASAILRRNSASAAWRASGESPWARANAAVAAAAPANKTTLGERMRLN
jgi:hypothetical protein